MRPILYDGNETNFESNGLGVLNDLITYEVTEVRNGEMEAVFEYPVKGRMYPKIKNFMYIKAKPNTVDEPHLFWIYDHEVDTVSQTIIIYAFSNTFLLGANLVINANVQQRTPRQAWDRIVAQLVEPTDFTFSSDITKTNDAIWTKISPMECIAGEEMSMLYRWGGEIKRGNKHISLLNRRGKDNVTTIRHGKNLEGFNVRYSTKGMTTVILPFFMQEASESAGGRDEEVIGNPVQSPHAGNYPVKYYKEVDYSQDERVYDRASLNSVASRYFEENPGIDKPSINAEISLADISSTSEYEKFKHFETIELTDTVTIYSEQYKVEILEKVNRVVYDGLMDRNIAVEVGDEKKTPTDDYNESLKDKIGSVRDDFEREIEYQEREINHTIQVAANGKNRVYRGTEMPRDGMITNDLWYKPVGAGEIELYVYNGMEWKLEKVSAGLLAGTLDADVENGDVNLINVNVANIVGETSNFVRSWWNSENSEIVMDGTELVATGTNGDFSKLVAGEVRSYSSGSSSSAIMGKGRSQYYSGGTSLFIVGQTLHGSSWAGEGTIQSQHKRRFAIGRYDDYAQNNGQFVPYISLDYRDTAIESNGYIRIRKPITFDEGMYIASGNISGPYEISFQYGGRVYSLSGSSEMRVSSSGSRLQLGTSGSWAMLFDNTYSYLYRPLDMSGHQITGQSDIRLKTNIEDSSVDALREIERMKFIEFEWDKDKAVNKNKPEGRQFGQVAQYSPFLQTKAGDSESYLSVSLSKQVNLNSKAIQELNEKIKSLEGALNE